MAKAPKQSGARKPAGRSAASARPRAVAARPAKRTAGTAAPVRAPRPASKKKDDDDSAVTRVTQEVAVRGNETRVERVVERAPRPSLPDVDRAAGRGRYVYCIIRASQPLKFGAIGMDEQWAEVYTIHCEDIHRLKTEISSQKGSTYFARMQYGRLIDGALQQRSERYVAEFLQQLRDVSVASRVNRAIGDKMIMNAAFLVQRAQEPAFDRRIKEIASAFDKLTFKYTGPWPPYNFVNIRLKLERAGQH